MKILCIGPSWVGDTIMAQSLFKLIKQSPKVSKLDVLAPKWSHPVLARIPEVDLAMVLPINHGEIALKKRWHLAQELKQHNYDQAIILPGSFKSALIPWLAKIPLRTGWLGEMRFLLLNDWRKLNKQAYPKMVDRYNALALPKDSKLAANTPIPKLEVDEVNQQQCLAKFNLNVNKPILALCPGAAYGPAKRWPTTYFAAVAKYKLQQGWQVCLFGSTADQPITLEINSLINNQATDLAGKINLTETIDLLAASNLSICNDSGLMHLSAAVSVPLVAIYGSTTPDFTPPLSQQPYFIAKQNLDCSPCFKRTCKFKHYNCLNDITPEIILSKVESFNV